MESVDTNNDSFDMESTDSSNADVSQSSQNDASSEVKLIIHHQFPGIELISSVYGSHGATCHLLPDQKIDSGSTVQTGFNIDPDESWSTGALMYKLQKRNMIRSNEDGTSNEDEATCTQLVIIWGVTEAGEIWVVLDLIEHDRSHVWDRDSLMKLVGRYRLFNIQHSPIENTWLIYGTAALMTRMKVAREEECYKLEITISETSIKDDTKRSRYVKVNR
jgi:hypothetical protein